MFQNKTYIQFCFCESQCGRRGDELNEKSGFITSSSSWKTPPQTGGLVQNRSVFLNYRVFTEHAIVEYLSILL